MPVSSRIGLPSVASSSQAAVSLPSQKELLQIARGAGVSVSTVAAALSSEAALLAGEPKRGSQRLHPEDTIKKLRTYLPHKGLGSKATAQHIADARSHLRGALQRYDTLRALPPMPSIDGRPKDYVETVEYEDGSAMANYLKQGRPGAGAANFKSALAPSRDFGALKALQVRDALRGVTQFVRRS